MAVEISSLNKKGLEIYVSLPRDLMSLERAAAAKIKERFSRGKVSAYFKFDDKSPCTAFSANPSEVSAAIKSLKSLALESGAEFNPDAKLVFEIAKAVSENSSISESAEDLWPKISRAMDEAADRLDSMRETEGKTLAADLASRLSSLSENVSQAEKTASQTPKNYRDALLKKLKNLGIESIDTSDERLIKEVCIFADKCDVSEEITRLKSHIEQFMSTMDEAGAVGRKLDFICQEMAREINTTASKANNLELTRIAISMKNINEQIREQIQNIE